MTACRPRARPPEAAGERRQLPTTTMPTASRDIVIRNRLGLHARPAMQFVELANQFKATVRVTALKKKPEEADGKSIAGMIILAAEKGTKMRIEADGEDAQEAVNRLAKLIDDKFGED